MASLETQKVDKLSTENAGVFAALTAQSLYKEKLESLALGKLSTKQKKRRWTTLIYPQFGG